MIDLAIIFALVGGFVAGCINTLAGNGSIITLGFLTEFMGLPGNVANGTNRLGVIGQGLFSLEPFIRYKKMPGKDVIPYFASGIVGALTGAWVAIQSSSDGFKQVYKYLVLILLMYTLYKSFFKNTMSFGKPNATFSSWVFLPVFFCFGFYGGYIQMGMGVFLLAFLLYFMNMDIISASALKILLVTMYTGIAIPIFHYFGLVNWKIGMFLFCGEAVGGWVTAQWANVIPNAAEWAHRFLIFIMLATVVKLFLIDSIFL